MYELIFVLNYVGASSHEETTMTSTDVIEALVKAKMRKSPAHKAWATRKLNAYLSDVAKRRRKNVAAALHAHATRICKG
jgi:hypothetical protein